MLQFIKKWHQAFKEDKAERQAHDEELTIDNEYTLLDAFYDAHAECCEEEEEEAYYR